MNSIYINEYSALLERILSTAYFYKFSLKYIEKKISYNSFFQLLECDEGLMSPYIEQDKLLKEIFSDSKVDLNNVPVFTQCMWAAEAYLRIQFDTGLTFESIFLYVPIEEMFEYFDIYHEMDFTHIINLFNEKYNKNSVLALILEKHKLQLSDIASDNNFSYNTLSSLKQRRRDIKKVNVEIITRLARKLRVRIETLSEIRLNEKY